MGKYKVKPATIEAFKVGTDKYPDWIMERIDRGEAAPYEDGMFINTLKGWTAVYSGDWVIKGMFDELESCKDGAFQKMYKKVEE